MGGVPYKFDKYIGGWVFFHEITVSYFITTEM